MSDIAEIDDVGVFCFFSKCPQYRKTARPGIKHTDHGRSIPSVKPRFSNDFYGFCRGLKTLLMSQLRMESTIEPRRAGRNPSTEKPGTIAPTTQKRSAFKTSAKSPKVRMVIGSARV